MLIYAVSWGTKKWHLINVLKRKVTQSINWLFFQEAGVYLKSYIPTTGNESHSLIQEQSQTISESFWTKADLVSLKLNEISKCLQISLSILTLNDEILFSYAISQRLWTSYISGCLTAIAATTASMFASNSRSSIWDTYSSASLSSNSSSALSLEDSFELDCFLGSFWSVFGEQALCRPLSCFTKIIKTKQ